MKKSVITVFVVLFVCVFAFAGGSKEEKQKIYRIGIAAYSMDNAYIKSYVDHMKDYFAIKSNSTVRYDLTVYDAKHNEALQENQVATFIDKGFDAIILNPVTPAQSAGILERINVSGIPCVVVNREPPEETFSDFSNICYVGAEASRSGELQGELIYALPEHGDINKDGVVSYVMLTGIDGDTDASLRTEYVIRYLTDNGVSVEELYRKSANWTKDDGLLVCEDALQKFGRDIDIVICNNDDMAVGALSAIEANGRKTGRDIYLVGIDATDEAVALIRNGRMTGTILNDMIGQSEKACDLAVEMIHGNEVEKYCRFDYLKMSLYEFQPVKLDQKSGSV